MNRKRLGIALGAALLVAAAWLGLGREPETAPSIEPVAQAPAAADAAPSSVVAAREGSVAAATDTAELTRVEVDTASPLVEEPPPLHVPDYGPALLRPTGRAVFELCDARSQPLEPVAELRVTLRRRYGEAWIEHDAELAGSRVVCGGAHGAGLPPGEYVLDVRGGPYGEVQMPFALQAHDSLERIVTLPHWRRLIRLDISDAHGRPLARMTQRPEYRYDLSPEYSAQDLHSRFARAYLGDPTRFRRGWEAYYLSDDGAFHVRVFAGLSARLTIELEPQRYGCGTIEIQGDFSGPEWDRYPLVVDPVPGLDERMATWVCVNPEDPGHRSLLAGPAATPGGERAIGGHFRLILEVDAPLPVLMTTEAGPFRRVVRDELGRASGEAGEVWLVDVPLGAEAIRCSFTDGSLYRAEARPRWIAGEDADVVEAAVRLSCTPLVLEVVPPTPTLAAYACSVAATFDGAPPWVPLSTTLARDGSGAFRSRTALSEDDARALAARASVTLRFLGTGGSGFGLLREFDGSERSALVGGYLSLGESGDARAGRLVGRLVDRDGTGLAAARVAVFAEERDEPPTPVAAADSTSGDKEPGAADVDAVRAALASRLFAGALRGFEPAPAGEAPVAPDAEFWEARLSVAPGDEPLEPNVASSDADGYVLNDQVRLVPGHVYVAVVHWTDADGTVRDHSLRFEATAGITDLGAIHLP